MSSLRKTLSIARGACSQIELQLLIADTDRLFRNTWIQWWWRALRWSRKLSTRFLFFFFHGWLSLNVSRGLDRFPDKSFLFFLSLFFFCKYVSRKFYSFLLRKCRSLLESNRDRERYLGKISISFDLCLIFWEMLQRVIR